MTDLLLHHTASNLLVSVVIAGLAFGVHRSGRLPGLAHLLWLLVLIKLVTPPLFSIPLVPIPIEHPPVVPVSSTPPTAVLDSAAAATTSSEQPGLLAWTKIVLLATWTIGSAIVLFFSLRRIRRFDRTLRDASCDAPRKVQHTASEVAARLGLRVTPHVELTRAHVSPLVWWTGGRVRIVIPTQLVSTLSPTELQWVLAHEVAHVCRRDHLVRWIEWLACVLFWWNPIAWWARRNLRISEEICCDALVLARLEPGPRSYANALLRVVEFLSVPSLKAPPVASGMGGSLERRFTMIVSNARVSRTPGWMRAGVLLLAATLLPIGVTYGQDLEAVHKRLHDAVAEGELSREQARAMMDVLRDSATTEPSRFGRDDAGSGWRRLVDPDDTSKESARERRAEPRKRAEAAREKAEASRRERTDARGRASAGRSDIRDSQNRVEVERRRRQAEPIGRERRFASSAAAAKPRQRLSKRGSPANSSPVSARVWRRWSRRARSRRRKRVIGSSIFTAEREGP